MSAVKILAFAGSLRAASWNKQLARLAAGLARDAGAEVTLLDLRDFPMPLYDGDLERDQGLPEHARRLRTLFKAHDGFLIACPEYNAGMPAVLKNAIDWGSRPYGKSSWNGKPAAVISTSQGVLSGFGANHHLHQSLVFLNMPTLQQPEAYIAQVQTLLDGKGGFAKPETASFLTGFLTAFEGWIGKVKG